MLMIPSREGNEDRAPNEIQRANDDCGGRIYAILEALHNQYLEADLGNLENPVDELVYISLSRQTHYQNASRSWKAVIKIGGPGRLVDMEEDELADLLKPSGFSRQKARWIKRSLEIIRDRMGILSLDGAEIWSDDELEHFLQSLPGISIKSAKCIMLYSMGRQVLPVDTHVRRIATRVGLVQEGLSEHAIHLALEDVVPPRHRYSFHVNCIWHGRHICTALHPRCSNCILQELCDLGQCIRHVATGAAA